MDPDEVELPPIQQPATSRAVNDTFWFQQAMDEATTPPIQRPRSISLGYVGDAPLTGGVMRDTPMPAAYPVHPTSASCPAMVQNQGYVAPAE